MSTMIDIGTLIVRSPEIRGGRPRIAGTGVTVRRIVGWYKLGLSPEEIADEFGHLTLAQVYGALAYYHANQEEIEADLAAEEAEVAALEQQHLKATGGRGVSKHATSGSKLYCVTNFEIVGDYTIRLEFDDGSEQVINFEPILYGPVFFPLRDIAIFNQVKLNEDFGTLEWPTGADIDPTVLHDWPEHVDSIIERRRKQFAIPA